MIVSGTVSKLAASATLNMSKKAKFLEAQGHRVFNFSVGEPDLFPPDELFSSVLDAIKSKSHLYTPVSGTNTLKKSILQYTEQHQKLSGWDAQNVCVSTGAKQVIYNALMASLESLDEVIIPSPYWVSYPTIVELTKARWVPVLCDEKNGFKLRPEMLRTALTDKTKWLILNSPNNPTGAVYDFETLHQLAIVLKDFPSVFILSDDIYESLSYTKDLCPHLLHVCPELRSRVLVVNGISKSFAATGWRLGWGIGPEVLIQGMEKIQSHSTSGPCCLVQEAVEKSLNSEGIKEYFCKNRKIFSSRRDTLVQALRRLPGGKSVQAPEGAFYVFFSCAELLNHPKIRALGWKTDTELAEGLLNRAYICTVPGTEFGKKEYLRFSYAVSPSLIEEGIEQLERFLSASL
ncbi:pyridoxal phosphate-dependent aminotransferase [Holospora undulata]|uniref:Aminotransferase n=1 Tax=Holospora undulata HU1 TaxID=1321371 RepID=A0A061JGM2_9PROT|nr:pyridoxal phosphate-dependent aminotransferase [Holospora undulata]ETZ05246.1 aspartate aminotransferase [Holospora undulata HU1]